MADKKKKKKQSNQNPTGYNPMGFGQPMNYPAPDGKGKKAKKKKKLSKAATELERQKKIQRKEYAATLRSRQEYAFENYNYRKDVEAGLGRTGVDNKLYTRPVDKKPKKEKDYYFVMRKLVCFFMFLILLVSVALYALNYVTIDAVPIEFTAAFVITEPKAEETTEEENEEAENSAPQFAEGEEDTEEEEEDETDTASGFDGTAYGLLDPVFGFIKFVSVKVMDKEIDLGDSPFYDQLLIKVEIGMDDPMATYVVYAFPILIIIYAITALVMMIKAFLGMFGRRIYKRFGLGSIVMIICAVSMLMGGLVYQTEIGASLDFGGIMDILLGFVTGEGGFAVGYGGLALPVLPVLVLFLSMLCKKKVPYSIFDNHSK